MKIGYLVPEFPGQTHAFFMRELTELRKRNVEPVLFSTRVPTNGQATHDWADDAAAETQYLTPMKSRQIFAALRELLQCGIPGWIRCMMLVLSAESSIIGRLKMLAMIPVAASMCAAARKQGIRHVHIHSCANAAWMGVFANRISGVEYSLTLHGPLKDYGPNQPLKWKFASFVIIITQDLLAEAVANIPPECLPQLHIAPMGVDVDHFRRDWPYQPATAGSTVRLVSCGRINKCKGHHFLIEAVRILREQGVDAELRICGTTDSRNQEYQSYLELLVEKFDLQDRVKLLGSVSEEAVRIELNRSHMFCLASQKEPLGVATMEAMAMEIPAIVTRSPGVCEMVTDGHDGILVDPESADEFVDQILLLLHSPEAADRIGRNGRQTIVERFSSRVSAEVIRQGIEKSPAEFAKVLVDKKEDRVLEQVGQ